MAARMRDVSRSRKAYSFYRPRPRYVLITDEEEMNTIQGTINTVSNLSNTVNNLIQNSNIIVWNEIPNGMIDGTNVVFTTKYNPLSSEKVLVFVNGVLQEKENDADYTLTGNVITFNAPPEIGSKVLVTYSKG